MKESGAKTTSTIQRIAIASQYQDRLDIASSHCTSLIQSDHAMRVFGSDILAALLNDPDLPMEFNI